VTSKSEFRTVKNGEMIQGKERGIADRNYHLTPGRDTCWEQSNREVTLHDDQTSDKSELTHYLEIANDYHIIDCYIEWRVDSVTATCVRGGTVLKTLIYCWPADAKRILDCQVKSCGREAE